MCVCTRAPGIRWIREQSCAQHVTKTGTGRRKSETSGHQVWSGHPLGWRIGLANNIRVAACRVNSPDSPMNDVIKYFFSLWTMDSLFSVCFGKISLSPGQGCFWIKCGACELQYDSIWFTSIWLCSDVFTCLFILYTSFFTLLCVYSRHAFTLLSDNKIYLFTFMSVYMTIFLFILFTQHTSCSVYCVHFCSV